VGGQAVFVGAGVCWLIGAVRTVRRRAPMLRRRHASRYVSVAELAELRLNPPTVGELVASAAHHRDLLARSRAWRGHWLTASLSDDDLDATLWHLTRTAQATADAMDAVDDANGHPELREQALAGQVDVAATTRAIRDDVARMAALAATTTTIDVTLAAADHHRDRLRRRNQAHDQLDRHRSALADSTTDEVEVAVSIAEYTAQQLVPGETRSQHRM
jgi:hypothetical protein